MRFATPALAVLLLSMPAMAQEQVTLSPVKDNTIYSESGSTSNGSGSFLFAGATNAGDHRRALLAFDVSAIPSTATIVSAALTLRVSRTVAGLETVAVYRMDADWGEGSSNADANEGAGAPASIGDATWTHRFFSTDSWSNTGGDYQGSASASASVGALGSLATWDSPGLAADVQGWVDGSVPNHGWIVVGASGTRTAKRFDSRENPTEGFRPTLTVTYTTGTAIEDQPSDAGPVLAQNWPNPFTGHTEVGFALPVASRVTLEVFDLLGRRVSTLVDGWLPAGAHRVAFEASQEPSGIYLARLRAGERVLVRQMARVE